MKNLIVNERDYIKHYSTKPNFFFNGNAKAAKCGKYSAIILVLAIDTQFQFS